MEIQGNFRTELRGTKVHGGSGPFRDPEEVHRTMEIQGNFRTELRGRESHQGPRAVIAGLRPCTRPAPHRAYSPI